MQSDAEQIDLRRKTSGWSTSLPGGLAPGWRLSPWWPGEGRAAHQRTTLQMLAAAVTHHVPLAPLVDALADEHRLYYRWLLRTLARRLVAGTPLADALEQTPGVVSDETTLAARVGVETGALAAALNDLAQRDDAAALSVKRRYRGAAWYVGGMFVALAVVVSYLMIRIVPSYVEIFGDFELALPFTTIDLIEICRFLAANALPLLALAALATAIALVVSRGRLARWWNRTVVGRFIRPIASLRIGNLWGHLATAAATGRPLAGAVSTLARYHYDPTIRRRLLFVRNELDHGAELFDSLQRVRLATAGEIGAIHRTEPGPERAWTLRQLAAARRERTYLRLDRWADVLFPLAVLVLGGCVLFVAAAMLAPITDLTNGLSG